MDGEACRPGRTNRSTPIARLRVCKKFLKKCLNATNHSEHVDVFAFSNVVDGLCDTTMANSKHRHSFTIARVRVATLK